METKNNSEFLSKVNAFQNEAQEFIEKSDKRHAVIVTAPLSLTKTGKAHVKPGLSWEMKKKPFTP